MLEMSERICNKAMLNEWLKYELTRYPNSYGFLCFLHLSEKSILRHHQILLRKTEYFLNTGKKIRYFINKLKLRRLQNKYALHIPLNCCGKGFRIMHVGPILINAKATIGENCKFHINTGVVAGGTNDYAPCLGNGIVVGVGAVILGGVKICDNVAIGANAVVNRDVLESDVAVAGVPAKIISRNGSTSWGGKKNKGL